MKGNFLRGLFGLLLWVSALPLAWGQAPDLRPSRQYWGYRAGGRVAELLRHSQAIDPSVASATPRGLSLAVERQTDGRQRWHHVWNMPVTGYGLHWFALDNPDVLGHVFAATAHMQYNFWKRARSHLGVSLGPGLMYATERYEGANNPDNLFLSTAVNYVIEGHLFYHWRLSRSWQLHTGVVFTHYSNGAIQHPNRGMNLFAWQLGVAYMPRPADWQPYAYEGDLSPLKAWNLDVLLSTGWRRSGSSDKDTDRAYTLSATLNRRVSNVSGLMLGLDAFRNEAIAELADDDETNIHRIGLHAGHELYTSRVSVVAQLGYYLYRPVKVDDAAYWRLGLKYYLKPRLFLSWMLKAHRGKADVVEWGVGYRLY